jgi:hypothetical protein
VAIPMRTVVARGIDWAPPLGVSGTGVDTALPPPHTCILVVMLDG